MACSVLNYLKERSMRMKCFRAKVYMFQVPCPCTTEPVRHRAYTSSVRAPQQVSQSTDWRALFCSSLPSRRATVCASSLPSSRRTVQM
jgi:hypothetical protein